MHFLQFIGRDDDRTGDLPVAPYIDVAHVVAIKPARPRLEKSGDEDVEIEQCEIETRTHVRGVYVDGSADDWAEKISRARSAAAAADAVAAAAAMEPEGHRLTDRGEWTAGETYIPLDYVTKPGTANAYLCLAENKSSSAGVLSNKSFWCPITLPPDETA